MNNSDTFKLGRSIAQILPFHRKKPKEIIMKKLVITLVVTAIIQVVILLLWI